MHKTLAYLKTHRAFILFLFAFSWILILKNKLSLGYATGHFTFHFDAPFWVFLNAMLIFVSIDFIKRKSRKKQRELPAGLLQYLQYFTIGFVAYLMLVSAFGFLVSWAFGTVAQNFSSVYQVLGNLFSQAIDFFIFGGFSLGYLYFTENRDYRQRISSYEISLSRSKVQQLKSQLNPHFLFNNLNVLDQLIEEDKDAATDFLAQFSEVYRYALSSSDKELIPLADEVVFAENYFQLMEVKYEGCYELQIDSTLRSSRIIVPPFCLQVLIENAITHNLGTAETPVVIRIASADGICVSSNKVAHSRTRKGNGVALKNLSEQFRLLTGKPIEVDETEEKFEVELPLLKTENND